MTRSATLIQPRIGLVLTFGMVLTAYPGLAAEEPSEATTVRAVDLRQHGTVLAADLFEGRQAGSRGGQAAAKYLIEQLRKSGLKPPPGMNDFRQEFGGRYTNILAVRPGDHPQRREEWVVIGAHYDHVGYGNRDNSFGPIGQIHNGADDNASGTAILLELARTLAAPDVRLDRSLLLAFWDAEETGLLGSQHWTRQQTAWLPHVRLAINCDMLGRLRENRVHVMGWRSAPGLRQRITTANSRKELQFDFQPEVTADSDHHPFFVARCPVLHFDTGKHEDYHRPSDDVEKVNWDGLATIARFLQSLIREAALSESLPAFRMEALSEKLPRIATTRTHPTPRLGLSWDPERLERAQQFVVFAVTRDTPAATAGLLPGDRIEAVNETTPQTLSEMRAIINDAIDTVTFRWQRPGQTTPITRTIHLAGKPVRVGWQYRLDPALPGCAVIDRIIDSSRADRCGIEPGDVLLPLESGVAWPADSAVFETWPQLTEENRIPLKLERAGRIIERVLEPVQQPRQSERVPAP